MDHSKKTMRHFYCRDVLWETFELMANDFDCSIDYLVNEAMRFYARSKNYQAGGPSSLSGLRPAQAMPVPTVAGSPTPPPSAGSRPPPPPVAWNRPTSPNTITAPRDSPERGTPQPTGPQPTAAGSAASQGPVLFLLFNQQRLPIDKDQFIIGRGSKTSDLAIKDGNISRKHAAVIRRNGVYYIKDLGSTNGIDYKGMRIDNKRIDEGDIFHICDYELRFTYQP